MYKINDKVEFILALVVLLIGLINGIYTIFAIDKISELINMQKLFYIAEILLGIGLIIDSIKHK